VNLLKFSKNDLQKLTDTINSVDDFRNKDIKCSLDIQLDEATAKVYHMGTNNPVIRIDLKERSK